MNRLLPSVPPAFGCALVVSLLAACSEDPSGVAAGPVTVTITSAAGAVTLVGDTVQFGVAVVTRAGDTLAVPAVSWSSSRPSVATIDPSGLVTAVGEGQATITAVVDALTATTLLAVADSVATYSVTFDATWSAATHPTSFPPNPHFSGLIGATHSAGVTFWRLSGLASPGIENMAETGSKSPLDSEVNAAVAAGTAWNILSGGGINPSPGMVSLNFDIHGDLPLVTLVSMIAPSPDWFVGVAGLSLIENGAWVRQHVVNLVAYDAGTDSGVIYTSPNAATQPPGTISALTVSPFDGSQMMGTFTFVRQ